MEEKMKRYITRGLLAGLVGLGVAAAAPQASAVDFSGQQVTLYTPGAAGSGNDIYARTLAPFMEKHLPGNPTILVRNLPGAGTVAGMNTFQQQAQPDGLHFVSVSTSGVSNYAFRNPNVQFDLPTWIPLLMSPQGSIIYSHPSLGATGPEDADVLRGKQLVYGGNNATGADLRIILMYDLLGWDVNTVWGLSRGPARLGYERGEFNINFDSSPGFASSGSELVAAGQAVPLFTVGIVDSDGEVVRDPNFPDLPHFLEIYEMVHGKPLEGVEYDAWRALHQMGTTTNKYLALPAGTPQEIVDAYIDAIEAMLADPEAIEKAASAFEGYDQIVGDAGRAVVEEATTVTPEVWEFLNEWLERKEGVTLGG
jgi:tripartite-type tricarboxylate transporter receptor subunit TctC